MGESSVSSADRQSPIAIIGMGCLFPHAPGLREYWRLIRWSEDGVTEVPESHWSPDDYYDPDPRRPDMTYCRRGAFLDPVDFDPTEFGIPPTSLEATDTAQLLGLVVAKSALDDAGYGADREFDRARVSVVLGVTGTQELVIPLGARLGHPTWRKALHQAGVAPDVIDEVVATIADAYVGWQESSFPGLLGNVVAGRIANRLNLKGTNCVVDAACASALSAMHLGMLELSNRRCDMVLTGGVDALNDIFMYMCFSKTQALSASGDAKPFAKDADGTVLGEGIGMVVLKRLEDAERDGDRIYAVIRGIGTSSDGKSQSIYAPRSEGQAEALRNAYRISGVDPATVGLVEAHGTGTKVGDAVEFDALQTVYREARSEGAWCGLGSVKSQIGHTKAAAGVAGLIKATLALHHKVLPATIKANQPNPTLAIESSPFYLSTETRPWIPKPGDERRASVSAFGFGGSNFHAVLEEYEARKEAVAWDGSLQIVALSANKVSRLVDKLSEWRAFVAQKPDGRKWAFRTAVSRREFSAKDNYRLVLVVEHGADPGKRLVEVQAALERNGTEASWSESDVFFGGLERPGKVAFLFPGQASQYVGMGRDLVCAFPEAHAAVAEADQAFEGPARLSDRIYPPPAFDHTVRARQQTELTRSEVAQPALGAVSLAMLHVLERFVQPPDFVAGHSYGELVALRAAGRIDDETLGKLSVLRGRLMSDESITRGAMLAVQAPPRDIARCLSRENIDAVVANRNSPTQGVVSGDVEAIEQAERACASRCWRTTRLAVSGAFHSKLMAEAHTKFRTALDAVTLEAGAIPVYSNCTARAYPDDPCATRDLLAKQLIAPVDFLGEIQNLHAAGARVFVEVGPRNVLTGLVRAILGERRYDVMALDASGGARSGLADLARVLSHLAALGQAVDLAAWDPDCPEPREPKMVVSLRGANYRSPKKRARTVANAPSPTETSSDIGNDNVSSNLPDKNTVTPPTAERPPEVPPAVQAVPSPNVRTTKEVESVSAPSPATTLPVTATPAPAAPATSVIRSSDAAPLADVARVIQEGLHAMQALQQQTAEAHQRFLQGQEQAHKTFQMVMQSQQRLVEHAMGLPVSAAEPMPPLPAESPSPIVPAPIAPVPIGVQDAPLPSPPADLPHPTATREPAGSEVETALRQAVSETTGFPLDVIELDMAIEDDLGIDRVRRVELFERLGQQLPDRITVDTEQVGQLTTLRQIVELIESGVVSNETAVPAPAVAIDEPTPSALTGQVDNLEETLLDVVAELTGYPVEMLDLDMDLEADLGIDSIKRVEILAAVQSRLPGIEAVDSSYIGSLRTLRNIIEYMKSTVGDESPAPESVTETVDDVPSDAVEPDGNTTQLDRRILRAVELPAVAEPGDIRIAAGREIWIADDGTVLAPALRDKLTRRGCAARVVALNADTSGNGIGGIGGLVLLGRPMTVSDGRWSETAEQHLKAAFELTKRLGPRLREAAGEGGALLATVARMDGGFGLLGGAFDPVQGGLAGLVKTAGQEWPGVQSKAIDVAESWDDTDAIAEAIVRELATDGPIEVGLDGDVRRGLQTVSTQVAAGSVNLGPGDVIVITGGARGVTADVAAALAEKFQPTLVLLGRSPEPKAEPSWLTGVEDEAQVKRALLEHAFNGQSRPSPAELETVYRQSVANREVAATVARIEQAGAKVVYRSVDVLDAGAVQAVMKEIHETLGPIRGLIHGAGVIEDRLIEDKTTTQFARVFDTKVAGLRHVLDALGSTDLRHLVLFSSVSGRYGRQGQVDYAMANEVLNKVAQRQAALRPSCRVVAINWGPWEGGMVTPALKRDFVRQGVGLIPLDAGARSLVAELGVRGTDASEVIIGKALPESPVEPAPTVSEAPGSNGDEFSPAFERRLDLERHAFLKSHVIGGYPVLPMAVMLEWLGHAALHDNPGLLLHGFDDFRVLKGVRLTNGPLDLRAVASKARREGETFAVDVEMRSGPKDGPEVIHARGRGILVTSFPAPPHYDRPAKLDANPYLRGIESAYDDVLFHGPHFHGVDRIEGYSAAGIVARVRHAPAPAEWMAEPLRSAWLGDPLAVDAGLQLGILWCHEELGEVSLPAYGARYRQYRSTFPAEGLTAVLEIRDGRGPQVRADITFLDAAGQVVARMEGYEWTVDASLRDAFGRSTAVGAGT